MNLQVRIKNTFLTQIHARKARQIHADLPMTICDHLRYICENLRLRFIFIPILICGLLTLGSGLLYGQDDYLNVKGNTRANTITFAGNLTDYPAAPLEGEIFYNSQAKLPRYFDGTTWKNFGGGPKTVATRIVAAFDTPNGADRADYVCNGTDDQHEINQAINSLPVISGERHGAVYLLEGTYNISDIVSPGESINGIVPHTNTALIGTGRGTVLKVSGTPTSLHVINALNAEKILITQLMIDGNNKAGNQNTGINFDSVTYSKIDKVWVENISWWGIYLSGSNNTISHNHVWGNRFWDIHLYSASQNTVSSNLVWGDRTNIYLESSNNNVISNNNVRQVASIMDRGISLNNSSNNVISNNNVQGKAYGIYLDSSSNNIISNNNAQGNNASGIAPSSSSNYNTISNNNLQGNNIWGLSLSSCSNNTITANVIYDNGGSGEYAGIELQGSNTNIISSNRIYDSAGTGYGINISATCDNNYLVGNLIDGAGYTGRLIRDLGTNTKYTDKLKLTLERKQINSGFSPLNVVTSPQTYVALNPSGAITLTLANGNSVTPAGGDLLILENISTNTVTIEDTSVDNINLSEAHPIPLILGQYDTLKLIWNGSRWLETEYVNNSP